MELTASIWKEGRLYVARCLELGVASQGKSKRDALRNLQEAVELYLEDLPGKVKIVPTEVARFKVAV